MSEYRFKIGDFAPMGAVNPKFQAEGVVTECLTSDIFSMLLCGVSDCIIVFSIVLAP